MSGKKMSLYEALHFAIEGLKDQRDWASVTLFAVRGQIYDLDTAIHMLEEALHPEEELIMWGEQ